jgi:hypothetical protein
VDGFFAPAALAQANHGASVRTHQNFFQFQQFRPHYRPAYILHEEEHMIRFRGGNGRRGSVIVLVVAVLALLAVLGTVYIVAARSERQAAAAGSTAANLDLAQDAVNRLAAQTIGESMYDGRGVVGGMSAPGIFGDKVARVHDIPEFNSNNPGYADDDPLVRDQSWLVANLYRRGMVNGYYNIRNNIHPCDLVADMTLPQTRVSNGAAPPRFSPSVFDPATGAYDIPILAYGSQAQTPSGLVGTFRVVADPLPVVQWPDGTKSQASDDAFVQLLAFSEGNGTRYRYGLRILDTSRMANLNAGMVYDMSAVTPLSQRAMGTFNAGYSLASPTIFNSGSAFGPPDNPWSLEGTPGATNTGRLGMWTPPVPIDYAWNWATHRMENPALLAAPILPYDLGDELELRSYGTRGTLVVPRPATGYAGAQIWPNTLGNHAANSNVVVGNANRQFYSTYTYSRDLRPYPDPVDSAGHPAAYQVFPMNGWASPNMAPPQAAGNVWPAFPARVAALPDISTYTYADAADMASQSEVAAERLVIAATNLATAMRMSGYSLEEQLAFAANYLTNRWNSWAPVVAPGAPGGVAYKLLAGPSFVDQTGLCLRTGVAMSSNGNFGPPTASSPTLNTNSANRTYVGYAAQPFINEAAVQIHFDGPPPIGTGTNKYVLDDCAIELYNPYNVALSLDDFQLCVMIGSTPSYIDLTGGGLWIPARGYFVLTQKAGQLDTTPAPIPAAATHTDAGKFGATVTFNLEGAGKIYLMRKYQNRAMQPAWAAVDEYDVSQIRTFPAADEGSEINFVARLNFDDGPGYRAYNHWAATAPEPSDAEKKRKSGTDTLTLGAKNPGTVSAALYTPLYDRVLDLSAPPASYDPTYQRLIPANINEFNRIMRLSHEIDPAHATLPGCPAGRGVISAQIYNNNKNMGYLWENALTNPYSAEAGIWFDFHTNHRGSTINDRYDPRAVQLLDCLAFTDRLSDYSIDLGDNTTAKPIPTPAGPQSFYDLGMSKLRIPGKINVNTASAEVLASIPVLRAYPQLIGFILAYRWRTNTADPRIPASCQTTGTWAFDFGLVTETESELSFPGYGIRSLAELQIPMMLYRGVMEMKAGVDFYSSRLPMFADRDALWGAVYNALTVRSDTFVVYAYLEAVRQNPKFPPAGFNNATVWHQTTTGPGGAVTDDPNDATHPLLRVARRRWVAIVDRSQCNYGRFVPYFTSLAPPSYVLDPRFTQAKVVAQKDLPQ